MTAEAAEFAKIIEKSHPEWSLSNQQKVVEFYRLALDENSQQNLTRLTTPSDFYFGHVVDVVQLETVLKRVDYPVLDIGSGVGVPGLLAGLLYGGDWIVTDSEKRKADFLSSAIASLGISNVRALAERAENVLDREKARTIVSRAVGTVTKLYNWTEKCSTWNNMVLFKGPGWDNEWKDFVLGSKKPKLRVLEIKEYEVQDKKRKIVLLERVPRGTK